MSKAPAIQQEGGETPSRGRGTNAATPPAGGEPSSRARGANAAPGTRRGRHASERQAVQAALHDGAGTSSSAMAAHGGHDRHVKLQLPEEEGGLQYPGGRQDRASRGQDRPAGHRDARVVTRQPTETPGPPRPYYVRPSRTTRPEQQPPPSHVSTLTTVGESLPTAARDHDKYPPHRPTTAREHDKKYPSYHQPEPEPYPRTTAPSTLAGSSPWKSSNGRAGTDRQSPRLFPADQRKKRRPLAFCFTLCCILFWLLVVGLGVAILVIYLLYHPQPPRLRVTSANLNAGYIDQLPPPRGGLALNFDLYALATIYNPNTKVDVVMRYMQLDLYFRGVMIGTTSVWPIHEEPGESVLRNVHLVVSEVGMSREDADAWHNATTRYGLVELKLKARFHVQLNFGRWLPFRYWVYPSCSLWLDPPPGGALRRARCRKSD